MFLILDLSTFAHQQDAKIHLQDLRNYEVTEWAVSTEHIADIVEKLNGGVYIDKNHPSIVVKTILSIYKQKKDNFCIFNQILDLKSHIYLKQMSEKLGPFNEKKIMQMQRSLSENKIIIQNDPQLKSLFLYEGLKNCVDFDEREVVRQQEDDILFVNIDGIGRYDKEQMDSFHCVLFYSYKTMSIGPILFELSKYDLSYIFAKMEKEKYLDLFLGEKFIQAFLVSSAYHLLSGIYKMTQKNLALPILSIFQFSYPSLEVTIENIYSFPNK